jgi:hypothetical protein
MGTPSSSSKRVIPTRPTPVPPPQENKPNETALSGSKDHLPHNEPPSAGEGALSKISTHDFGSLQSMSQLGLGMVLEQNTNTSMDDIGRNSKHHQAEDASLLGPKTVKSKINLRTRQTKGGDAHSVASSESGVNDQTEGEFFDCSLLRDADDDDHQHRPCPTDEEHAPLMVQATAPGTVWHTDHATQHPYPRDEGDLMQ